MKSGSRVARFGWRIDFSGKLVQHVEEQGVIVKIATQHARGESDAEIAQALRRDRIPGPGRKHGGDGKWWPQTIGGILRANRAAIQSASELIAYEAAAKDAADAKRAELLRIQSEEIKRIAAAEGVERFTFKPALRLGIGVGSGIDPIVEKQTAEIRRAVESFIDQLKLPAKATKRLYSGARRLMLELMLLRQTNLALRQQLAETNTLDTTVAEVDQRPTPAAQPNGPTPLNLSRSFIPLPLKKPSS